MVGHGKERPDVVQRMLDIDSVTKKPQYSMAAEARTSGLWGLSDMNVIRQGVNRRASTPPHHSSMGIKAFSACVSSGVSDIVV